MPTCCEASQTLHVEGLVGLVGLMTANFAHLVEML